MVVTWPFCAPCWKWQRAICAILIKSNHRSVPLCGGANFIKFLYFGSGKLRPASIQKGAGRGTVRTVRNSSTVRAIGRSNNIASRTITHYEVGWPFYSINHEYVRETVGDIDRIQRSHSRIFRKDSLHDRKRCATSVHLLHR